MSEGSGRDRGSLSNSSRLGSEAEFTTQENKLPLHTNKEPPPFHTTDVMEQSAKSDTFEKMEKC